MMKLSILPFQRNMLRVTTALLLVVINTACRGDEQLNVLLVTFDTTRADRLGCYGNTEIETPALDGLASEGVLFSNAFSAAPITAPSHSTILTGQHPLVHGVRDNGMFVLAEEQQTLAETLRSHGWATGAAVGSFPLVARFGFDQGFDLYDDHLGGFDEVKGGRRASRRSMFFEERPSGLVNEAVYPWLKENASRPFFLWLHYWDPHQPYDPPTPYDQLYANDLYNGEIAYADHSLGTLIEELKKLGVYDRTLIVMTGDHGEGMGEHDELTHAILVYNTTIRVPLLIRHPKGTRAKVVSENVASIDIVPTILDLLGLPTANDLPGCSLAEVVLNEGQRPPVDRLLYSENLSTRLSHNWGELRVLFHDRYKYMHGPRRELFDLAADPNELRNLIEEEPQRAREMEARLGSFLREHRVAGGSIQPELNEEARLRLEALGYLTAGGSVEEVSEELRDDGIPPQDMVGNVNRVSRAKQALNSGQFLQAVEHVGELLVSDPTSPIYLEMYANAYLGLGRVDEAWEVLHQLQQLYSVGALPKQLVRQMASIRFLQGYHQEAFDLLLASQEERPDALSHYLLADLYGELGQAPQELSELEHALKLDPHFIAARIDLAVHYAQKTDLKRAEQELRRVLADDPYSARAHFNFGALHVQLNQLAAAAKSFRRAIELNREYLQAYLAIIAVNIDLGERSQAEHYLAELESLAPGSPVLTQAKSLLEMKEES